MGTGAKTASWRTRELKELTRGGVTWQGRTVTRVLVGRLEWSPSDFGLKIFIYMSQYKQKKMSCFFENTSIILQRAVNARSSTTATDRFC